MSERGTAFERALAFCRGRKLFAPGDRVLVGSASGAASLGALGFLRLAQRELGIAEIAVGAIDRGGADDPDAVADTGRFARQLGVAFHAVSSEGRRPTAALLDLAAREGYTRVALGHTRDDATARALRQLARGDLRRIRPLAGRRRDGIVRPLLALGDGEALELARTAGLEPVMLPPDPHARAPVDTRIRERVLPRLRIDLPGADAGLVQSAREIRQLLRWMGHVAEERIDGLAFSGPRLEVEPVTSPLYAAALARASLRRLGVDARVRRAAERPLALLLLARQGKRSGHEVVLGSGLVASYVPERRVVALRVVSTLRSTDERIG